jgi:predicted Zn-dependent protease
MLEKMTVADLRPLEISGYRGATGLIVKDPFMPRRAAVHDSGNHLHKLLYMAPRRTFRDLDADFLASRKSFHPLAGAEPASSRRCASTSSPSPPGDTPQTLAARMALRKKKMEWFRALNGLGAGDAVKAGDRVKLVEAE